MRFAAMILGLLLVGTAHSKAIEMGSDRVSVADYKTIARCSYAATLVVLAWDSFPSDGDARMRNFLDIQEATVESKHWGDETPTYTELGLARIYMEIQLQQAGTDSVARDVLVAQTAAACAVDLKALEAI